MEYIYLFFFITGLCVGSFLNVVIYRLPINKSIVAPRSSCPNCGTPIAFYDNIPIFSFLLLRGKCRHCKNKISPIYPLVEFLNALLWLFAAYMCRGDFLFGLISAVFSSVLLAIFFIDYKHYIIPDSTVIMIAAISIPLFFMETNLLWYHRIGGLLAGGGILYLLAVFSEIVFKKEGMGGGDIKMVGACGLILGYKNILLSLFLSSVIALVLICIISAFKKKTMDMIPFGPALALGILICHYFGEQMIAFYIWLL